MKIAAVVSTLGVLIAAGTASAAVIAQWDITTAFPTGTGNVPVGTNYSVGAANAGDQTAGSELFGQHTSALATWTSPAGNGSQYSFSSNNWGPGDFYEARVNAAGYQSLNVSWDQARSSTGPATFDMYASIDGGSTWTLLLDNYVVNQSGGGGSPGTWSSTATRNMLYNTVVALPSGYDNAGDLRIRFQNDSIQGALTGTNRVDNVVIEGTLVPTPASIALLGLGGLVATRRRRA